MKRKIVLILLCLPLLTGCWDKRELNELGIVGAFGIDSDQETGEMILTTQIIRPSAMKKDGGSQKSSVELVTSRGKTIFEAVRNAAKQFDRRAYYAQSKVIIVSEQVAHEKMNNVMDFLTRSPELRETAWIVIAKGVDINAILTANKGVEEIQANYLASIIRESRENSEAVKTNILEFIKNISGSGINPVAGSMTMAEMTSKSGGDRDQSSDMGVKYTGTAVFKRDKLVGYLDEKETRGFNWIMGKVKSGIINIPSPDNKDKYIALEIKRAKRSIKPEIIDGKISFTIQISEIGTIVEEQTLTDISKLPVLDEIVKLEEEIIEAEIARTLKKVQKELGSDIFGFGQALNRKYPKEWAKVKNDWDKVFPKVDYTIEVEATIRKSGLLQKEVNEPLNKIQPEVKSRNRPQTMYEN